MANLIGPVVGGQSAAAQGQILMLVLASAALLYVLAKGAPRDGQGNWRLQPSAGCRLRKDRTAGPASARLDSLASAVMLRVDIAEVDGGRPASSWFGGIAYAFQKRSA